LRLNYAVEMRYGVLVDLARKVFEGAEIDVSMGYANVIWQGDASAMALASLVDAASPPLCLNVTGPECLRVRDVCQEFGRLLGKPVRLTGTEASDALLSNAQAALTRFGPPRVGIDQLIRWIAHWISRGGPVTASPPISRSATGGSRKYMLDPRVQAVLQRGIVIPAHPLALDGSRRLDERRQRALSRYYVAAGAGGLAVGVHTTQFEIREPAVGLFRPVLTLAAEEMDRADAACEEPLVRIGGVCGPTRQAVAEAGLLAELGYHAGLLSLAALRESDDATLVTHCRAVAEVIPVVGFYLQPAVGGRVLSYRFWRAFLEIENVVAVKIAPFNRYQTLDVVRAVAESGRDDVALYTGNDDNIVPDLLTPYRFTVGGRVCVRRIVGGLLGHWAVWTRRAVELLAVCHRLVSTCQPAPRPCYGGASK